MLRILLLLALLVAAAGETAAQVALDPTARVALPDLVATDASNARAALRGGHPLLRTLGTLAGSAGGFALVQDRSERDPDDLVAPMAAGVAGAAVAALIFSNAHPARVIAGSLLAALPAAALATQLARTVDDDEQGNIPLISFSVPHGLLTSAFAIDRR